MASSNNNHQLDSPSGAEADVPPHERGQEPYSVGPSPQLGENVVVGKSTLPTHHSHVWPVGAPAPGQEGSNRLTFGAATRMGVIPPLSPTDELLGNPTVDFGEPGDLSEPSGAPEQARHLQTEQRPRAHDVTNADPSNADYGPPLYGPKR